MPSDHIAQVNPSATAEKILGADRRPKGSAASR